MCICVYIYIYIPTRLPMPAEVNTLSADVAAVADEDAP